MELEKPVIEEPTEVCYRCKKRLPVSNGPGRTNFCAATVNGENGVEVVMYCIECKVEVNNVRG